MEQIRGTQKEVAAQRGTWETLVASAKNFFISSSVNTTFIADPLWEWERREPRSASLVNSREWSVLGTRAQGSQGHQQPLYDRLAKEAPDSSHLLCSWLREPEVVPNYSPWSFPEKTGDLLSHSGEIKNCVFITSALLPNPLPEPSLWRSPKLGEMAAQPPRPSKAQPFPLGQVSWSSGQTHLAHFSPIAPQGQMKWGLHGSLQWLWQCKSRCKWSALHWPSHCVPPLTPLSLRDYTQTAGDTWKLL